MAFSDYYLCDRCGAKAFYDANLNYDGGGHNPNTHHPWPDGHIGWMMVLCTVCAEEFPETIKKFEMDMQL